jgi:hypothetical protein
MKDLGHNAFERERQAEIKRLEELDWNKLEAEVENKIYAAGLIFEQLEFAGRIRGNGHHHAQKLSGYASEMLNDLRRKNE